MLNLLAYITGMGITLYIAAIYRGSAMALLAVLEGVYLCLSILFLLYQRSMIHFELQFPQTLMERGLRISMTGKVRNRGRLPAGRMAISLRYRVFGRGKSGKLKLAGMNDGSREMLLESELRSAESGSYLFDRAVLRLYDPLRLLFITKRIRLHVRLDIMPDIHETGVVISEQVRRFGEDSADAELFQIRPYRDGDRQKDIHWKLSAREQELMVRENRSLPVCGIVLFLDFAKTEKRRNHSGSEAFWSLVFSISYALLDKRCPHYAVWFGRQKQDIVRVRIEDEESLAGFLVRVFEEPMTEEKKDLPGCYRDKYAGENWAREIGVNRKLEITLQGKTAAQLHEKKLSEELGALELLL